MHIQHTLLPLIALITTPTLAFSSQVEPTSCQSQRVQLQMLGTRGPEFLDENASTGYLIWLDDKALVIVDAGPGSLQRFKQSKANYEDVELMLFSHFHSDHSADFPSYVKSGFFTGRTKTLDVIGPSGSKFAPSAEQFVKRAIGKKAGMYPYLGEFIDPDAPSSYKIKTSNIPWSSKHLSLKEIYHKNGVSVKTVPT